MLTNIAPCTFWVIVDVFSRPRLLQDIRDEVSTALVKCSMEDKTTVKTLNVTKMETKCPLLHSVLRETLRTRSTGSSIRRVQEDFLLADRYLLQKGSILQMPHAVIHQREDLWGNTAKEYDSRRFIKAAALSNEKKQATTKPGMFRGFGGGATLCPGRHLAAAEITAVVAMLAVRFDILPLTANGWGQPRQAKNHGETFMVPLTKDMRVRIRKRQERGTCEWRLEMEKSKADLVQGSRS